MYHQNQDERGQTALETAIILIAFIVVASVFAFTILSAGTSSTEKGEEAIYAGLEGVQSSMSMKGAVIAKGNAGGTAVDEVVFTVALVSGGDPVDLTEAGTDLGGSNAVVIGYRDENQFVNEIGWTAAFVGTNDGDDLLEEGELAEITVNLRTAGGTPAGQLADANPLGAGADFTLEVKPPTGAILNIERTTPAAIATVMELR